MFAVGLDGLDAYVEHGGDFLCAVFFNQQLKVIGLSVNGDADTVGPGVFDGVNQKFPPIPQTPLTFL